MQQQQPAFDPFIPVIADRGEVVLYKERIDAEGCRDAFFIVAVLAEDHIRFTEEIVNGGEDKLDGSSFGVAFEILDDPDGLGAVLFGKSILKLKNIILLAD